jgi:hypothetical protein
VKTPVHELAVVQSFTDVRQVFESDNGILELSGVLDGLPRCFLDNIRQCVLVVVESFVHAPLGGVSRL